MKKRVIVTFKKSEISQVEAGGILSIENIKDGVSVMATDISQNEEDVFHFEGLGSTSIMLTENDIEKFKAHDEVLAVEEDIEVTLYDSNHPSLQEVAEEYYKMGYAKGVWDTKLSFNPAVGKPVTEAVIPLPGFPNLPALHQPAPWNINMVNAPKAWARQINGFGVKVAVIDTGIAQHNDLIVAGGTCFIPGISSFNDDNGHGTHCAGVIGARDNAIGVVGVAPSASLYAVKVLSGAGNGQLSWILAGMAWALQNKMQIVSMSLGSESAPIEAYRNAITQLTNGGVTVVCAAGNSFGGRFDRVGAPANSHPLVVAVGAVDSNKVIANFSERGTDGSPNWNGVSVVAPGVSVNSTYPFPANSYKALSGTSMACPHVAGVAALVKQKFPTFTPAQVKQKIMSTAADLGAPGYDTTYGAGLVDADRATL